MHATHQVLPRRPVEGWCPGRSPGFRIILLPTPSRPRTTTASGTNVGFVPDYSDGVAADSHRLPWGPHPAGRPDTVNAPDRSRASASKQADAGSRCPSRRAVTSGRDDRSDGAPAWSDGPSRVDGTPAGADALL